MTQVWCVVSALGGLCMVGLVSVGLRVRRWRLRPRELADSLKSPAEIEAPDPVDFRAPAGQARAKPPRPVTADKPTNRIFKGGEVVA
ncbi:hypothetical protein [Deinococcus alpinitundrae]|uniref:hypothetical protein n=1 Tax=Deinococcus alpinitundrae TaxID=468913 RepID=UPI001379B990|nr:hypothetical protein [Deinococcus alpinitundrae]